MTSQAETHTTSLKPVFFVVGSTGSGKSAAAVKLAHALNRMGFKDTVVVNCDVMQFYEVLPVATNKANLEEMEGIPHTFLSFLSCYDELLRNPETPFNHDGSIPTEAPRQSQQGKRFDVNSFTERASAFINNYFVINPIGAVIVCGGTCYYAEALLFANCLTPTDDTTGETDTTALALADVRDDELWDALNTIDPVVAQRYHPNDTRRLKRLLEIYQTTKKLPSDMFAEKQVTLRFGVERTFLIWSFQDTEVLFPTLDHRVDVMVKKGLVEEVREFFNMTRAAKPTTSITEAIGYKEYETAVSASVDASMTERLFIEKVKANTRRYARQQVRWIKNRFVRFLSDAGLHASHFAKVDATSFAATSLAAALLADTFIGVSTTSCVSYPLVSVELTSVPVTQERCDLCEMTLCGRDQMTVHLKSKRHRGAVKRATRKKSFEEAFGRALPPSKRAKPQ